VAIKRDDFPLPDVDDPLTAPYFAGAARSELVIPRCESCGEYVWYPADACPRDGGALTWTAMSGRGTLFTWAVVQRAFLPAFEDRVPFVTALVALDEDPAVRLCTYVVDTPPEDLVADAPVAVTFRPLTFTTVADKSVVVPMFVVA
jgi:uncharacterized OB-fold protein